MENKSETYSVGGVRQLAFECTKESTKRAKIKEIENLAFESVKEATKKANISQFVKFIKNLKQNIRELSLKLKMSKKEIDVFCEKCNRKYTTANVNASIKGKQYVGGYCDSCSKNYQIEKYGRIIEE